MNIVAYEGFKYIIRCECMKLFDCAHLHGIIHCPNCPQYETARSMLMKYAGDNITPVPANSTTTSVCADGKPTGAGV